MNFSRTFLLTFAAMALVIAIALWVGFEKTKGNHLAPTGHIGRVRTHKIEEGVAIAVIDFSMRNDSDREMVVRSSTAKVQMPDGSEVEGSNASAADATKVFAVYPDLGEQFNPALKDRDRLAPHQEIDRMLVVRFDIAWAQMEARQRIALAVEDITGPTLSMVYPK